MLLISLIGEQPIPNLLPIRYLKPDRNLLVYTNWTKEVARRLRSIISSSNDLSFDICVNAYDLDECLNDIKDKIRSNEDIVFNLTGGTKMMALAAYALALQSNSTFIYLKSEGHKSMLYRYYFKDNLPHLQPIEEIPPVITVEEYLNAYLPGFVEEGFSTDDRGDITEGGLFERAVYNALKPRLDEVLCGVRPKGVAQQIEIDLVMRYGNQVGIAEIKLGGKGSGKRGMDQLKMAGEPTYLGTYTAQFMIVAKKYLSKKISTLANKRRVKVIYIPNYQRGKPLSREDADRLAYEIQKRLST